MAARNKTVKTSADDTDGQEWKEDQLGWQRAIEARKRKIQCAIRDLPVLQTHLDFLKLAGADPDKILLALAFAVPDSANSFKAMLKSRQRHLSALADKLDRLSDEVGKTIADPLNASLFMALLIPGASEELITTEKLESLSNSAHKRIKPISDYLRWESKALGAIHQKYDRIETTNYMGGLVKYVKESTGEFHDERIADLLQAAHDALGVNASFTAEKLRKLRQRQFPSLVRKRKTPTLLDSLLTMTRPLNELDKTVGENWPHLSH